MTIMDLYRLSQEPGRQWDDRLLLLVRDDYVRRPATATVRLLGSTGTLVEAGEEPGTAWYAFDHDSDIWPNIVRAHLLAPLAGESYLTKAWPEWLAARREAA